jgi:hypothetical protein
VADLGRTSWPTLTVLVPHWRFPMLLLSQQRPTTPKPSLRGPADASAWSLGIAEELGPGHCPEPVAWRGSWRARNGRRYRIEACEGHRPALDKATGPVG